MNWCGTCLNFWLCFSVIKCIVRRLLCKATCSPTSDKQVHAWMSVCDRNLPNEQQIGPLQLAIHVVQNHHAGEQKSLWDKTTKRHTILNGNFLCLSCPSATFALQHGGCVPREWLAAKGLLMLTPPSPRPTGMWLLENSTCWKIFVLSQCDFCSPARRLCATWMASCKGPINADTTFPTPHWNVIVGKFLLLESNRPD